MSKVTISGNASGTGTLTIAAPNTNSDITLNLPTTMGTNNGSSVVTTNAAGNLGLGVAPSATGASYKSFELGFAGIGLNARSNATLDVDQGVYWTAGSAPLYASTGVAAAHYRLSSGTHAWYNAPSGTAGAAISFVQAMTLDASGNLLVGTLSNTTVSGITSNNAFVASTNNRWVANFRHTTATTPWGVAIDYTGVVPNNTSSEFLWCADGTLRAALRSNGGLANYQANNVNLSDRREKTNFAPAKSYLETICAIPVQTFNYIDQNMEEDGGLTLGVVAQDVQAVAPEMVMESNWGSKEDPKMRLSIYQTDLQYALMKAIQELKAIVDAQGAQIAMQSSEIATLTAAVAASKGTA